MNNQVSHIVVSSNGNHTPPPLRALVVEDDEIIQAVHKFMLERLGFQVEAVANGKDAIDKTETQDYAAVLLDLGLPDVQGEDVIVAIRTREQVTGKHLPIIANSAHAIAETLQTAKNLGADIVLEKPVLKEDLERCLSSLGLLNVDK